MPARFRKIAVFYNQRKPEGQRWAKAVCDFIKCKGLAVAPVPCLEHGSWEGQADLVIALGGDGTVLHAARDLAGLNIPLLAVNSGTLGFLSGMDVREFSERFPAILKGNYQLEPRYLLEASVQDAEGRHVNGPFLAFNDCVLKTPEPRAFSIKAFYGGRFMKSYFGDGLIIATPPGSTAYSLAASGPIVEPGLDVFILSPICPHSLTHRPVVLSASSQLVLEPSAGHGDFRPLPILSMDGQAHLSVRPGERAVISKSDRGVNMLFPSDYDYFDVLRMKLKWGER